MTLDWVQGITLTEEQEEPFGNEILRLNQLAAGLAFLYTTVRGLEEAYPPSDTRASFVIGRDPSRPDIPRPLIRCMFSRPTSERTPPPGPVDPATNAQTRWLESAHGSHLRRRRTRRPEPRWALVPGSGTPARQGCGRGDMCMFLITHPRADSLTQTML